MADIGYALSSEEFSPLDLVRNAVAAEEAGFPFALISDHFHPWVDAQGHSPFVWCTIGGIAQATTRLRLGTGVTCPTVRIHPAIIAQAAATAASMMPGRFFLGIGSGENLNEHILGDYWPSAEVRLEMMEEAVDVIRLLWKGGQQSHHGQYFVVENARVYTLPDPLPPIYLAAAGAMSATVAAGIGDGLITVSPQHSLVDAFQRNGGEDKPIIGQATVCWAPDEQKALDTAYKMWPNGALVGQLSQELPTPAHFEQVCSLVTRERLAQEIVCGPDPQRHVQQIQKFVEAGFTHVYVHQVGPDQAGFLRFYEREVLPHFRGSAPSEQPASKPAVESPRS